MTYVELKELLAENIKKNIEKLTNKLNAIHNGALISDDIRYSNFDRFCEIASEGLDLIDLKFKIKEYEALLLSIDSDFNKPVYNLPIVMFDIIRNATNEDAVEIFIRLIRAKSKTNAIEFIDNPVINEYEKRLYGYFKKKDWKQFKIVYDEYISYFLHSENIEEFFIARGFSLSKLQYMFGCFGNLLISEYLFKDVKINESVIEIIRNGLNDSIENNNNIIADLQEIFGLVQRLTFGVSYYLKEELNKRYNLDLSVNDGKKDVLRKIEDLIMSLKNTNVWILELLDGLTNNGFKVVNPIIAGFAYTFMGSELDIQKVLLSGIKFNSLVRDEPTDKGDLFSYNLEVQMGDLISNDLKISIDDLDEFLALYKSYLEGYITNNELATKNERLVSDAEVSVPILLDNMRNYILSVNAKAAKKTETKRVQVVETNDPLMEYISGGKVVKVCDLNSFKKLLETTSLSDDRKTEYYRQMSNAISREITQEKETLLNSILESDKEYYDVAKASNRPEALQIINEINALIDLIYESTLDDEKEEFRLEIDANITYLKEMFKKINQKDGNTYDNILYYGYYEDYELTPYVMLHISNFEKVGKKQAYAALKKIIDGKIANDLPVKGDLPVRVWYKGKDVKVFYTKVGSYTLIIGGFSGNSAFNEVKNFVNSKAFLTYLKELTELVKTNKVPSNSEITSDILRQINEKGQTRN